MRRAVILTLLLLGACTFDLGGRGNPLTVEVSEYPVTVPQDGFFEVLIDVLNVTDQLEVAVTPPEEITVAETVGGSYVVLGVTVPAGTTPKAHTITVALRSGESATELALGFTVTEEEGGVDDPGAPGPGL